jgi:hypothetical protein
MCRDLKPPLTTSTTPNRTSTTRNRQPPLTAESQFSATHRHELTKTVTESMPAGHLFRRSDWTMVRVARPLRG